MYGEIKIASIREPTTVTSCYVHLTAMMILHGTLQYLGSSTRTSFSMTITAVYLSSRAILNSYGSDGLAVSAATSMGCISQNSPRWGLLRTTYLTTTMPLAFWILHLCSEHATLFHTFTPDDQMIDWRHTRVLLLAAQAKPMIGPSSMLTCKSLSRCQHQFLTTIYSL